MRQPIQPNRVERGSSGPSRQGAARRGPVAYTEYLLAIHPVGTPSGAPPGWPPLAERTGIRRFLLMVEGAGAPGYALETSAPRLLTGASLTSDRPDR
jgi:hypothetical protein